MLNPHANAKLKSPVLVINFRCTQSFSQFPQVFLLISQPPEMFAGLEILIAFGISEVKPGSSKATSSNMPFGE